MQLNSSLTQVIILPLAITFSGREVCVAGITKDKKWIRPMTPNLDQIVGKKAFFQYDQWSTLQLGGRPTNARVEDWFFSNVSKVEPETYNEGRTTFFEDVISFDVETAFSDEKTTGLIRAQIEEIYWRNHTGGRKYLRIRFKDMSGDCFDWIFVEYRLSQILNSQEGNEISAEILIKMHQLFKKKTWLTIGLGDKNERFPGKFDGRHPLCTGIHFETISAKQVNDYFKR